MAAAAMAARVAMMAKDGEGREEKTDEEVRTEPTFRSMPVCCEGMGNL
jgi:hypothetical protein